MQHDYSLITLIRQIYGRRKTIISATAAAAVISLVVSFMVPVYYMSSTTFYAASETLAAPNPVGASDKTSFVYGTDTDRDRLLSMASSGAIADYLIELFGLYEVYEIDSTDVKGPHKVREKLKDLYVAQKTEYGGIEITVEDQDPNRAAEMANAAREWLSDNVQIIIKNSQNKTINNLENSIRSKENLIRVTDDTLQRLRRDYEIYDTKSQGGLFSELITNTEANMQELAGKLDAGNTVPRDSIRKWKAQLKGLQSKKKSLDENLQTYSSGLATVLKVERELSRYTDQITIDKERLNQLRAAYEAPFAALHIIQKADPPVVKSRPKKAVIILVATILVSLLTVLAVLIVEAYRKIDWKAALADDQ